MTESIKISFWKANFQEQLRIEGIAVEAVKNQLHSLVYLPQATVVVQLIDIQNDFTPNQFIDLALSYQTKNIKFIQLWEDVWIKDYTQVIDRFRAFCGLNIRIHGRKTTLTRITKPIAQSFLYENHLQGFASARFKYALLYQKEIVAVATFSSPRKMNVADEYYSVELIRFAIKRKYSIAGGLSKLVVGFCKLHSPNDIMTYIDIDWGNGSGFEKLEFTKTGVTDPQFFSLDADLNRIKIAADAKGDSTNVFNTGSIKMILNF